MNKIPNIYHFIFGFKTQSEEFHLAFYLCIKSCVEVNSPEKIYFHYRNLPYGNLWEKIRPYLHLNRIEHEYFIDNFQYKDPVIKQFRYAHIADIVRLEVLKKYGGIYADIDTLFVNPLPDIFFQRNFIMGHERVDRVSGAGNNAEGSLCNAWIASAKEAPFCDLWLNTINERFDGSWSAHSTFLPYTLSQQHPELIHIEPERSFFYFDWSSRGINRIFKSREKNLKGIYSIHLWSHLWWSPSRNNFSTFNHQRLTERYIQYSSTTYGKIAGRFTSQNKFSLSGYLSFLLQTSAHTFADIKYSIHEKKRWLFKGK